MEIMNLIRRNCVKGAVCFSVLCALGSGACVSHLNASIDPLQTSEVENSSEGGGGATLVEQRAQFNGSTIANGEDGANNTTETQNTRFNRQIINQSYTGLNLSEPVIISMAKTEEIKSMKNTLSIGIDIGSYNTVVTKCVVNGEATTSTVVENSLGRKITRINNGCNDSNFMSAAITSEGNLAGALADISCDDVIRAICEKESNHKFCDDKLHSDMLKINGRAKYKLVPLGIMDKIEIQGDGKDTEKYGKYIYENGQEEFLSLEQYQKLDVKSQHSDLTRAARIFDLLTNSSNGNLLNVPSDGKDVQITLTYGGQLSGKEISRLVAALEFVIKDSKAAAAKVQSASGAANNSTTVLEAIRSNTVNLKLRFMPQSLAAQTQYFYENRESAKGLNKLVIVNLGYGGLSVSGSEFTEKEMKVYTDKYSTDCAGRAIDEAIMEDFKKEIKEVDDTINVDNLTDKQISNILKELTQTKEKLSAEGADEIAVNLDLGGDQDDINFTYSVDKLNECLTKAGIVDHFDAFVRGYIKEHKDDLKDGFNIAIIGGSLRIPLLQTKLQNILKECGLKPDLVRTLNMDESLSAGACCLGVSSSYNVSASEKVHQLPGLDKGAISRCEALIETNKILTELAAERNAIDSERYSLEHLVDGWSNSHDLELDSAIISFCDQTNKLCENEVGKIQNLINYGYTSELKKHQTELDKDFNDLVGCMQQKSIDQKLKNKVISTIQNLQSSVKEKFSNMKPQPVEDFSTDNKQTDAERTGYMRKMKAFDNAFNETRQRVKEIPAPQKLQIFVQKEDGAEKVIVDSPLAYTMRSQMKWLQSEVLKIQEKRDAKINKVIDSLGRYIESASNKDEIIAKVNKLSGLSGIKGDELSSISDSKTIVDRILLLQTFDMEYRASLRGYTDTSSVDTNHAKAHFKDLASKFDQKYGAVTLRKVANELLNLFKASEDQKLSSRLRKVFKMNAKLDWINVLQDDMNGLLKTAGFEQPAVMEATGQATNSASSASDSGTDTSTAGVGSGNGGQSSAPDGRDRRYDRNTEILTNNLNELNNKIRDTESRRQNFVSKVTDALMVCVESMCNDQDDKKQLVNLCFGEGGSDLRQKNQSVVNAIVNKIISMRKSVGGYSEELGKVELKRLQKRFDSAYNDPNIDATAGQLLKLLSGRIDSKILQNLKYLFVKNANLAWMQDLKTEITSTLHR